jgi:flagellar basal-body rod protein FlgC
MSLSNLFTIAGTALTAQSQRLNVVASNLANADSATSTTGTPYHARQVMFAATPVEGANNDPTAQGVRVTGVVDDPTPMKLVYDPKNPLADEKGNIAMPNVNVVEEMVNMISASRSYQNNADVMNTAKTLMMKTLTIGQ